jgi:hypothetical protein
MYLYYSLKSLEKNSRSKKKKVSGRQERVSKKFTSLASAVREGIGKEEELITRKD